MARELMTMEQILSILRDTPERLRGLAGDLTEARLRAAPEPGEWSVTEIAADLRSCADVWGQAIETIAGTDYPTIRAVSSDHLDRAYGLSRASVPFVVAGVQEAARSAARCARTPSRPGLVAKRHRTRGWHTTKELTVHSYAHRLARHERTHWRQVAKTVRALLD